MARITMRKVQETELSEVFTLYLASAAARGVKDKTLRTYEQHFNAKLLSVSPHLHTEKPDTQAAGFVIESKKKQGLRKQQ